MRNDYTQARNGNRANCAEMHHPIASGLRQKSPRSVTPARKVLVENCLGASDRRSVGKGEIGPRGRSGKRSEHASRPKTHSTAHDD